MAELLQDELVEEISGVAEPFFGCADIGNVTFQPDKQFDQLSHLYFTSICESSGLLKISVITL